MYKLVVFGSPGKTHDRLPVTVKVTMGMTYEAHRVSGSKVPMDR